MPDELMPDELMPDTLLMVAGAILCGGASRRMGRTKALVEVSGVPMGRLVGEQLEMAGCAPVVLVGGGPELDVLGWPLVEDLHPGDGPVGGVLTALAHHRCSDAVVVVACDLPCLDAASIASLIAEAERAGTDVDVVVAYSTRREPALAVWRTSVLDQVKSLFVSGLRSMHGVLDAVRTLEVTVDPAVLLNVNRIDDVPERISSREKPGVRRPGQ